MRGIRKVQGGFTLIELVVVIVVLGILAATALPKFVDLSTEAGDAAAQGAVGAINSATSINYAKVKAGGSGTSFATGAKCSDFNGLMLGGTLPDKITWVNADAPITCNGGVDTSSCKLKHEKGTSTGFATTLVCTS